MIYIYAGKQGAGKTLRAVCDILKYDKWGSKIYANQYIKGTYKLLDDWYNYRYDENSLLVIDEAQLSYNCRNYSDKDKKQMYEKILSYLTLCRHYRIDILFITQSLNRLDVQIRELATAIFRFSRTIRIPWLNLRRFKICRLPILQIGREFEDDVELQHYLNSVSGNYNAYGRLFLRFINFKALGMYDTHIIDKEYMDKEICPLLINEKFYYKGVLVC